MPTRMRTAISNHFGICEPYVEISVGKMLVELGSLGDETQSKHLKFGRLLFDESRGTAFFITKSGEIFERDIEDDSFCVESETCVFFSDAGLYVISEIGVWICWFSKFSEYYTRISFEQISEGSLKFEHGDGTVTKRKVSEVVEKIGQLDVPILIIPEQVN